jgi:hypothetical protein
VNRVAVNVFDDLMGGLSFVHVPILAWTRLPETPIRSVAIFHSESVEELQMVFGEVCNRLLAHRPCDVRQNGSGSVLVSTGPDEKMHVLGHDYPCPKIKRMLGPSRF